MSAVRSLWVSLGAVPTGCEAGGWGDDDPVSWWVSAAKEQPVFLGRCCISEHGTCLFSPSSCFPPSCLAGVVESSIAAGQQCQRGD